MVKEISVPIAVSIIGFFVAPVAVYFSSQMATASQIADVRADVRVQEVKTETLEKALDKFETKIDTLLRLQGVDPARISQ